MSRPTRVQIQDRSVWTPEYWRGYCEADDPYRRYKWQRDRTLAVDLLQARPGQQVLEVGCGYGRISQALLDHAAIHLVGIDRSRSMLKECSVSLKGHLSLCQGDAARLPFRDQAFDAVLCNAVLMHLRNPWTALAELRRVLHPGGRLVVSFNNLLSPFALPVWLWSRMREGTSLTFHPPWRYRYRLRRLGIALDRIVGDTFLAVALHLPGTKWPVAPAAFFQALRAFDRWVDRAPLNHLAYEVWFQGTRIGKDESS